MNEDKKKTDKTVVVTYVLLLLLAASMYLWIYMAAPWERSPEAEPIQKNTAQTTVSNDEAVIAIEPVTATPTPFVKKASNNADNGCIGDEGLVW